MKEVVGEEANDECPICGSAHLNVEFAQVVTGQVNGPQQAVELLVCANCSHIVSAQEVE